MSMRGLRRALVVGVLTVGSASLPLHAQEVVDWSRPVEMDIALSSFAFQPAQLNLQHGTVYRLHLVNQSGSGHDFDAPQLFAASDVAPADRNKIGDGAVEVDGGTSVDVEFVPLTSGSYAIKCTHFLHAMFGMRATATVK